MSLSEEVKKLEVVEQKLKLLDSYDSSLNLLEEKVKRLEHQNYTVLEQHGSFRVAIKNLMLGLDAALGVLNVSLGYTQDEVSKMSADDYKRKVLLPLGLGKGA